MTAGQWTEQCCVLDVDFRSNQLPVAPQGDFLYEQKVTKEPFRRRGLRFPRLLKTSTLEPPKRNRARFLFDSLRGRAKLQFCCFNICCKENFAYCRHLIRFASRTTFSSRRRLWYTAKFEHCTNSRGYQKGERDPTFVVVGEGSQGEGESKHPLPVRFFGNFLFAQKVTPRSVRQRNTAKSHIKTNRRPASTRSRSPQKSNSEHPCPAFHEYIPRAGKNCFV